MKHVVTSGLACPPLLPVLLLALVGATGCSRSSGYRSPKSSGDAMASPMTIAQPAPPAEPGRIEMQADSLSAGSFRPQGTSEEVSVSARMPGRSTGRLLSNMGGLASGTISGFASGTTGGSSPPPPPVASPVPVAGPKAPGPEGAQATRPREMLAVEAHVTVDVPKVNDAVVRARALIAKHGGQLLNDVYNDGSGHASAALSIRVPTAATEAFLAELGGLGRVRERRVQATDVGQQFHDQSLLLRNLKLTLARYEELRKSAKDTKDLLAIENEITRLRTQIERVESELTVLGDRVDRSTIYLTLQPIRTELPPIIDPEAVVYPDLHATYLRDLGDKSSYLGGGVGARLGRYFGLDVSALRRLEGPYRHDLVMATVGGEVYSDFLGGGRRTFGNVFLGARIGVLHGKGRTETVLPLTVGVELLHLKVFTLELRGRGDVFFGSTRGAHLGLQPDLAAVFAF